MTKAVAVLLGSCCCLALGACDSGKDEKAARERSASVPACGVDSKNPGPLMRGGLAHVRIEGRSLDIDVKAAPALCGPIYNYDVPKLNAKAGDGLLLQTCVPEGSLQITAYERKPGKQQLHSAQQPGGTEILFNQKDGPTYSTRGIASDSIVLSDDMWKAQADVTLYDVMGNGQLKAKISVECHPPTMPAVPAPGAEPAQQAAPESDQAPSQQAPAGEAAQPAPPAATKTTPADSAKPAEK